MLRFDHLTIIAPSLEEGIGRIGERLGISLGNAARHRDMGTHNRRVRLGADCYLEVIAVDPEGSPPPGPRWFGLDRTDEVRSAWSEGSGLRGWVARTDDIDAVLARHGHLLGTKRWLEGSFHFAVPENGQLPMGGVLPSVIDLAGRPPTAHGLVDQGVRLTDLVLEHPDPREVQALYEELGIEKAPRVVHGERVLYRAEVETREGARVRL